MTMSVHALVAGTSPAIKRSGRMRLSDMSRPVEEGGLCVLSTMQVVNLALFC